MTYEPLPAGRYVARAVRTQFGMTKNGIEELAVLFRVAEGPLAGREVTGRLWFSDAARDNAVKSLRAMGLQGDNLEPVLDLEDASAVLPSPVQIKVDHETYEGKTQVKVKYIDPIGEGAPRAAPPLAPDAKRAFAARMRGVMASAPATGAGKPAPQAARLPPASHAEPHAPDDQVPF